jgi:vacuolar-type H+-ATPase subunit H
MEEIIRHILEVEKQAKKIVEDGRKEAEALLEKARESTRNIVANARDAAHSQSVEIVNEALRRAEQAKQKRLEEIRRTAPQIESINPDLRRTATSTIIARICGLEGGGR